ncbi:hypothetical protein E2C01_075342 [Portunus trituberculatus]|uniref:Uncharacterized protein n=1 Tax=Portunus trituberculatus TaxID=210409 RepID=A0A5B7IJV8_PORTR|nr:hypothetical protein [Portunus trituberculatus]
MASRSAPLPVFTSLQDSEIKSLSDSSEATKIEALVSPDKLLLEEGSRDGPTRQSFGTRIPEKNW